jgi:putative sterol carrier protein
MDHLDHVLRDFGTRVNDHQRLRSLLDGWDRVVAINATDTGRTFTVTFRGSRVTSLEASETDDDADLTICAPEQTLLQVFSGDRNPTGLFLEGVLQVFASDRDQVKLDAITLVLWD